MNNKDVAMRDYWKDKAEDMLKNAQEELDLGKRVKMKQLALEYFETADKYEGKISNGRS